MRPLSAIETERLTLRRWRDSDRHAFHLLNGDPAVMSTVGEPMTRAQSDAWMNRIEARHDESGFGLWCLDLAGEAIGFAGFMAPWFRDGVEIGWRIRSEYWGQGFAPEAALACLQDGFDRVGFSEVLSFTALTNYKSQRVMDKVGLSRVIDGDFDHPSFAVGHRLRRHALYRLERDAYRARRELMSRDSPDDLPDDVPDDVTVDQMVDSSDGAAAVVLIRPHQPEDAPVRSRS